MNHLKRFIILAIIIVSGSLFAGCNALFNKNNKAGLQVLTNDATAAIFLDGQYLENTPYINKELAPGQYLLKIQPEDSSLIPYETTIELRKGLLTVVTWKPGSRPELGGGVIYELEKLGSSSKAEIAIATVPDGAVISIDDGEKEFSPLLKTDIQPGTHDISISLPSYETQSHTVNVIEGHRLNVLVTLAKNPLGDENEVFQINQELTSGLDESAAASQAAAATAASTKPSPSASPKASGNLENVSLTQPNAAGKVTITTTNFFQDGKEVLRVRDAVGVSGEELGFAAVGSEYVYLDETQSGWLKIDFEGKEGWVSSKYAKLEE